MARRAGPGHSLGISSLVTRLPAVDTPNNPHGECALSHRRVIEQIHRDGLDSVLVLEDDVVFLQGAGWVLRRSLAELVKRPWKVLYLGGFYLSGPSFDASFARPPGCRHLKTAHGLTSGHAIAYHRRICERLLAEMPRQSGGNAVLDSPAHRF